MGRKNTKRPKGNTKEKSDTCRFEEKGNKMGWALRERRKKVKFSKSQSEFLLDVYNEGERSGKKTDPASVVEPRVDLIKLATKDAIKPFTPQEYPRKEQISACFSCLTIQRRKGKGMESVSDQDQDGFEEGSNDEKHACLDEESDENENEDSESEDNDKFENTDESDDDCDESDSDMDDDEDLACAIEEDLKDRELKNELDTSNDVLSSLKSSSENAVESNGSLEVVPIYGNDNCLFRAIASGITTTLISCKRNEGGYPIDKVNAAIEAKLASELRSKAVDMLRSNRELCQSHAEDIGLDYLWKGDEYGSLDSRLKEMEKNSVCGGQPEILALTHVLERPIVVHFENQDKTTEFGRFFNSQPCHILYHPEEKDEQGQQKRAGHYDLLWRVRCQVTPLVTLLLLGPGTVNSTWLLFLSWIMIQRKLS